MTHSTGRMTAHPSNSVISSAETACMLCIQCRSRRYSGQLAYARIAAHTIGVTNGQRINRHSSESAMSRTASSSRRAQMAALGSIVRSGGGARLRDARQSRAAKRLADVAVGRDQRIEPYTGFDAQALEQVDQIIRGEIAGGARRIGTASEARHRRIEDRHSHLQRRIHIGQALAVGIVVMPSEVLDRYTL